VNFEDIYTKKNALSAADIAWLKSEMEILKNLPEASENRTQKHGRQNRIYLVRKHYSVRKQFEDFLSGLMPFSRDTYRFHSINFYELQNSYGLHCDNLGEERGFYQAIIPIECPKEPTYTVIFDQTATENVEWVSPVFNKPKDYKPHYNRPIFDANWFGNWKNEYRITDSEGEKFWGERWNTYLSEAYKGFSIKHAYEWTTGDLFLFNSRFTHCASDLEAFGIEQKTGLLMCLEKRT